MTEIYKKISHFLDEIMVWDGGTGQLKLVPFCTGAYFKDTSSFF